MFRIDVNRIVIMLVCRIKAFLQQCALRSQDFAACHRKYIEFENPDRCGSAFSPDSVRKMSCLFNAIFRARKFS